MTTGTNTHWDTRAESVKGDCEVNIADVCQRNLEHAEICPYLRKDMRVLEVGCGNGYSTSIFRAFVKHIDAFDCSESMIERAKHSFGETNNRFIVDDVLRPQHLAGPYDLVLCVRVLINLRDLAEQRLAVDNLTSLVKPGGLLILVEGFNDGFVALDRIRQKAGMQPLEPARINFYSFIDELRPQLERHFTFANEFHLGSYDYLTRFVYPCIVGSENVQHNTSFHEKFQQLAAAHNPDCLREFSRVRGYVMGKKDQSH